MWKATVKASLPTRAMPSKEIASTFALQNSSTSPELWYEDRQSYYFGLMKKKESASHINRGGLFIAI
jgi:hypothetical protein